MKLCSHCERSLPSKAFARQKNGPQGLRSRCRECSSLVRYDLGLKCSFCGCQKIGDFYFAKFCSRECHLKSHVRVAEHGCWEWIGGKAKNGYGRIGIRRNGKSTSHSAHKVSYETFVGRVPKGLLVLHSCHNRACINPAHLDVGTHKQNSATHLRMTASKRARRKLSRRERAIKRWRGMP